MLKNLAAEKLEEIKSTDIENKIKDLSNKEISNKNENLIKKKFKL